MSSILKALRKLENDKSTLGEAQVDLARDILKRRYEDKPVRPAWILPGLIGLFTVLVFGSILWVYWPQAEPEVAQLQGQASPSSQPPTTPAEITETGQGSEPRVAQKPQPQPQTQTMKSSLPREEPIILPTPEVSSHGQKQPPEVKTSQAHHLKTSVAEAVQPPAPVPPPKISIPDLVVSQIVYSLNPAERMAIINDLPVMEATDIEGAQVLEISPDRVLFSYQGIEFVKTIQKSN